MTTTATRFPLSNHTGGGDIAPAFSGLHVYLQFMWEVRHPPSPVEAFLLLVAGCVPPLLPSQPACEGFPPPTPLQCSGCPALLATCLFCCYCLLVRFCFFPGWGLVCPGGYADVAQGCLWEYCILLSLPCGLCLLRLSGCYCLVVVQEPFWFLHLT
jgi:hypothetical protein